MMYAIHHEVPWSWEWPEFLHEEGISVKRTKPGWYWEAWQTRQCFSDEPKSVVDIWLVPPGWLPCVPSTGEQ